MRQPFNPKLHAVATLADGRTLKVKGRPAQALQALYEAGQRGINPAQMSNWALRLASYIYDLRGLGLTIVTERVDFPGGHYGQYYLKTPIAALETFTPPPNPEKDETRKAGTARVSDSKNQTCENGGLNDPDL